MSLADAIRKRINNIFKMKNLNMWKLYKRSGVPMATLSAFMSGKKNLLTLRTLLHICEGFDMKLYEFFNDPLFDDVEQE